MISYSDNAEVRVGDFILIEDGRTPGTVYELIETPAQLEQWRVEGPGIMVETIPDGLVFLPIKSLSDDPIAFVSRSQALSSS